MTIIHNNRGMVPVGVSGSPSSGITNEPDNPDFSDGVIVNNDMDGAAVATFTKNGSTIGGIGASSSGSSMYIGNGDVTMLFSTSSGTILPRGTAGVQRDGVIDLGSEGNRFKDLYISGGIQLGGTESKNLLDDYEFGSFTPRMETWRHHLPTIDSKAVLLGSYTKIGRSVTCQINISSLWLTGSTSGLLVIKGLPFTPSYLGGSVEFQSGALGAIHKLKFARKDNTALAFISTVGLGIESTNNGGNYAWEKNNIVMGGSLIRGSITYFTDS